MFQSGWFCSACSVSPPGWKTVLWWSWSILNKMFFCVFFFWLHIFRGCVFSCCLLINNLNIWSFVAWLFVFDLQIALCSKCTQFNNWVSKRRLLTTNNTSTEFHFIFCHLIQQLFRHFKCPDSLGPLYMINKYIYINQYLLYYSFLQNISSCHLSYLHLYCLLSC